MHNFLNYKYNYYPFGSVTPGRSFSSGSYRYSAFGFEKDDEVKGSGNHFSFSDFGFDPRLARRWQIDPKNQDFPWQGVYNCFNNNPIFFIDPSGESGVAYKTDQKNKDGKPIMKVVTNVYIYGSGATDANAKTMQDNANAQFNNNGNYFTATVDGVEYEVQFDIKVQVIDSKLVDTKLVEGGYGNLNAENNYYEIRDDIEDSGQTLSGPPTNPGGNTGVIKTSEISTPTTAHELNHGYAGENKDKPKGDETKTDDNDIAVQAKNSKKPAERKVTQGNIDAIFKHVSFKEGSDKANVGNPRPQLYDKDKGTRTVPQN
ncbi:MAG: hypothetical protein JNK50_12865 [Bacteroidia bacterium]|nr:hypothetical protein [Bacteroidia bacterium]